MNISINGVKPVRSGCKDFGDSWINWWLFVGVDEQNARDWLENQQENGYFVRDSGGPGETYVRGASLQCVGRRVLLTQSGGRDI